MTKSEKQKKLIRILEEEACEMCEWEYGDRYDEAKTNTETIKKVAEKIIALFQEGANNNLTIELNNLGESSMRTVKRELKVLIEDYGYKKMISGSINVKEGKD